MTDTPDLRPASSDEIIQAVQALSFALRCDGRKRVNHADEVMARITADRLVLHLELAGFVLMKKAPFGDTIDPAHAAAIRVKLKSLPRQSSMRTQAPKRDADPVRSAS
jgi:hypothetical protein